MKAIYKYDGPLGTYALEEQNGLLTRLWLGAGWPCFPERPNKVKPLY